MAASASATAGALPILKGIHASFNYIHDRLEAREELKGRLKAADRLLRTARQEYTREQILELRYNELKDIEQELEYYTAELKMYKARKFFGAKKNVDKIERLMDRVQRALTQYHDAYLSFENPPAQPKRRPRKQEKTAPLPAKKKGIKNYLQERNGALLSYKQWK